MLRRVAQEANKKVGSKLPVPKGFSKAYNDFKNPKTEIGQMGKGK